MCPSPRLPRGALRWEHPLFIAQVRGLTHLHIHDCVKWTRSLWRQLSLICWCGHWPFMTFDATYLTGLASKHRIDKCDTINYGPNQTFLVWETWKQSWKTYYPIFSCGPIFFDSTSVTSHYSSPTNFLIHWHTISNPKQVGYSRLVFTSWSWEITIT